MAADQFVEHGLVVRFYDQPDEKIDECFEAMRMLVPGLVNYATRPLQSTLRTDGVPPRFFGARNTECMLMFDSAEALARFKNDPRAREIYSWYASPDGTGQVITDETHVLKPA
jgi:hypothetical protein